MMNRTVIDLCNRGVSELHQGNPNAAFESLSKATNIVMMKIDNHRHVDKGFNMFRFQWEDCSSGIAKIDGFTSFLSMRALRISTNSFSSEDELERMCPCGYAWVIWFNLALCCSVIGTCLGEKGRMFLETAYDLYERVQERVDKEPSIHSHWKILTMVVSNNQACIFHDFCMRRNTIVCLHRMASTLASSQDITLEDRGDFCLNLQILGSQTLAPAA